MRLPTALWCYKLIYAKGASGDLTPVFEDGVDNSESVAFLLV